MTRAERDAVEAGSERKRRIGIQVYRRGGAVWMEAIDQETGEAFENVREVRYVPRWGVVLILGESTVTDSQEPGDADE